MTQFSPSLIAWRLTIPTIIPAIAAIFVTGATTFGAPQGNGEGSPIGEASGGGADCGRELQEILSATRATFEQNVKQVGPDEARRVALEQAKNDPRVSWAGLHGENFSVVHRCGVRGWDRLRDPELPEVD